MIADLLPMLNHDQWTERAKAIAAYFAGKMSYQMQTSPIRLIQIGITNDEHTRLAMNPLWTREPTLAERDAFGGAVEAVMGVSPLIIHNVIPNADQVINEQEIAPNVHMGPRRGRLN